MGSLSKFFQDNVQHKNCQTLGLHVKSCQSELANSIIWFTLSNFKYFAPACIIPLLTSWRKLDKNKLREVLDYYCKCSLVGTAIGCTTHICLCSFRKIFDQFHFYTFLFAPAAIGGCMLNFGSPRVRELFETSMFQCNVETFFLMRRNVVSRLIADSRLLQTYVFMLASALILQGKQLYNRKGFWLLSPNPKLQEKENRELNKCELHEQDRCNDYLMQGLRKYLALGLTLDMVKALMTKVDAIPNQSQLWGKMKNFRIRSTALLTAYVGIYRFTHCYLNRHSSHTDSLNHITSAFLAGFCYYFYPQSTLFSYALVQAIKTLWTILKVENAESKNSILQFLFRIPFGKILFPFALGNSVHLVCLKPEYCSHLTNTITNGVTNNYPYHIQNEIILLKQKVKNQMAK